MVACFRHRRGRAAVHRAAARQGPARCASTSPQPAADRRATSATSAELEAAGPGRAGARRPRRGAVRGRAAPPAAELDARRPVPDHVHLAAPSGEPKAVRARPALPARPARAGRALARRPRPATWSWCTAATAGRSRPATCSSRPWLRGAARAAARRALRPRTSGSSSLEREARRRALHGADRVPRDRQARARCGRSPALRGLVAAGEALNPEVLRAWHEATGL